MRILEPVAQTPPLSTNHRPKKTFFFLPGFTDGRKVSRRELELINSQAKQHAASVSHASKRLVAKSKEATTAAKSFQSAAGEYVDDDDALVVHGSYHDHTVPSRRKQPRQVRRPCQRHYISPSSGSHDPFSTFPIQLNADATSSINYFRVLWSRLSFQAASTFALRQFAYKSSTTDIVQRCMQDQLLFDAFTAAVALRMITIHQYSTLQLRPARAAGNALTALRQQISSGVGMGPQHFLSILFLAAYEFYCNNFEGCRTHLRLLRDLGALEVFDGYILVFCRNLDAFSASSWLARPVFPSEPPQYTLMPPTGLYSLINRSSFPTYTSILGPKMIHIVIPLILDCADAAETCRQHAEAGSHAGQLATETMERCGTLAHPVLGELPATPEKEACIIALLIWLSYMPIGVQWQTAREDYRRLLSAQEKGLLYRLKRWSEPSSELQLWVVAVGVVFSLDPEVTSWCSRQLHRLTAKLHIDDLMSTLRKFLWLENFELSKRNSIADILHQFAGE